MAVPAEHRYTYREYLALERRSERKGEFLGIAGIGCTLPVDELYDNPLEA